MKHKQPPEMGDPVTLRPVVEVEEEVYRFTPPENGAGPMWTFGNTCIVRHGGEVLASGMETLPDHRPLNNIRWTLFRRDAGGWTLQADGGDSHEREPCPLVVFPDGRIWLSVNPNTCGPDAFDSVATPQILEFTPGAPHPTRVLTPVWKQPNRFHGHTYRSLAADAQRGDVLLFYNSAYDQIDWTLADAAGSWTAQGSLAFPWGADYEQPQPIRVCYPAVALRDGAAYVCGVSDIIEPNRAWRDYKRSLTGQDWDYDFRRLFYTWSDDLGTGAFHAWVEIASREATCGWIVPCDLHVGGDGSVHVLWTEKALDERLRPSFFPEAQQSVALNYAVIRAGEVVHRSAVQAWHEGDPSGERPGRGRFQVLADGGLVVFYHVEGTGADGTPLSENRVVRIGPDGPAGPAVGVPLTVPLSTFYTATPRAGSAPSNVIDLFGQVDTTMRYARVRLCSEG